MSASISLSLRARDRAAAEVARIEHRDAARIADAIVHQRQQPTVGLVASVAVALISLMRGLASCPVDGQFRRRGYGKPNVAATVERLLPPMLAGLRLHA